MPKGYCYWIVRVDIADNARLDGSKTPGAVQRAREERWKERRAP
jgi:hypothetical protein